MYLVVVDGMGKTRRCISSRIIMAERGGWDSLYLSADSVFLPG